MDRGVDVELYIDIAARVVVVGVGVNMVELEQGGVVSQ